MPGKTTAAEDPDAAKKPRKKSRIVLILVWMIAFPATIATFAGFAGFAGRWHWTLDLFNHARVQYLLALIILVAMAAIARRWRTVGVITIPLMVNLFFVAPFLPYQGKVIAAYRLQLTQFNVNTRDGDKQAIAEYLNNGHADIIFTQEVNLEWVNHLANAMTNYDLVKADPRSDNFGIAMFVRNGNDGVIRNFSVDSATIIDLSGGSAQVPAIDARIQFNGRAISILSVHTLPPVSNEYAAGRDDALRGIAKWTNEQTNPAIIIGDLNATPWSCHFRDMMAETNLVNSMTGRGPGMTWPAGGLADSSLTMIPIDHCLHTDDFQTVYRSTGSNHGSDHRPLHVSLILLHR